MKAKKILITGANGYIGSALATSLAEKKFELTCFCGPGAKGIEKLENFFREKKANAIIETGSILDRKKISSLLAGIDIVVHTASVHSVEACRKNPEQSRIVNVGGTKIMVEESKKAKIKKFIYPSSMAVYGNTEEKIITEETGLDPKNDYAIQKINCEKLCIESKLECAILRKSNIFGTGFIQQFDTVIPLFVKNAIKGEKIIVHGTGKQERNFVHIKDVIRAYQKTIESDYCGILNIGGKKESRIIDIAKIISKKFNAEIAFAESQRKDQKETHRHFSCEKAKKEIGYEPKVPFEKGLEEFIEWAKKNKDSLSECF